MVRTNVPTFGTLAEEYIATHEAGWSNPKHRDQWKMTLRKYCAPLSGIRVDQITKDDVEATLKPLLDRPETCSRTRGRIEAVLELAASRDLRAGDNPAARVAMKHRLGKLEKLTRGHHPALPYKELPAFWLDLQKQPGTAAKALAWTILTSARTGETIGATWEEIDFSAKVWIIPGARMKAGQEHVVPLNDAMLALIGQPGSGPLFPSTKAGQPLSNMAMLTLLKRMGRADITVHGFRSTFRDWAGNESQAPRELIEEALAHTLGKVEAAYRRGQAVEKRRDLLEQWATFCLSRNS